MYTLQAMSQSLWRDILINCTENIQLENSDLSLTDIGTFANRWFTNMGPRSTLLSVLITFFGVWTFVTDLNSKQYKPPKQMR